MVQRKFWYSLPLAILVDSVSHYFRPKDVVAILQQIIKSRRNFQRVASIPLQSAENAFQLSVCNVNKFVDKLSF